ncbi:helicase, partial [Chroococcidiopsidales cyanobacterium LEGE 13417]|nr:helicase [Chroococcidiopsidales cyanobacterium LEGE 13417]
QLWLRQASDLLTLLVMLRSTIHTRIKGDAGLRRQRIAFVPVGLIGDEELLSPMFGDVKDFLREAQILFCDEQYDAVKPLVKRAEQLTRKIFAGFNLLGQAANTNAKSYVNYRTLEALAKTVSRSSSRLLPSLENDSMKIPDCLTCIGPFWMEDWSERKAEERFNFEGWRLDIQAGSSHLLGLLRQIYENFKLPPKLKRPAKELYKLLIREKDEARREYSTLQAMQTQNIVVGLPLDYPHFWREQLEEDTRFQELEDPEIWRSSLGRALISQGLVMPVVGQYQSFPWAAVVGYRLTAGLTTLFGDRYFMASNELNLLNTVLLEDEEE